MPTFVLNDENQVNSYGFRIPNSGISLERFKANPVMLDDHFNSTRAVLGKWVNLRLDSTELKADDEFDTEDADAQKIAGKVKRGYIKGASMGVTFNRDYMKQRPDGTWLLEKCELYEASIVAIPSNANCLRLFAENGTLLSDDDVKLSISQLTTQIKPDENKTQKMEKIILTAAAIVALASIGMTNTEDPASLSAAIEKLKANHDAEKTAHEATKVALKSMNSIQSKKLVEDAVLAGKITADLKDAYTELAEGNFDLAAKTLGSMPGKVSLSGMVVLPSDEMAAVKTVDDFEKLGLTAQLAFKKDHPEAYAKLFI